MAPLTQRRVALLLVAACFLVGRGSSVSLQQRSRLEASEKRRGNATSSFLGITEASRDPEGLDMTDDAASTVSALQQASYSSSTSGSLERVAQSARAAVSSAGNPWQQGIFKAFMDKFNIPVSHGSGVYVDLGKSSGGYRQVSGRCPVFGKYIKLLKNNATTMTFLEEYPASGSSTRPLPGGFNLSYVGSSGRKVSPIKDSFIHSVLGDAGPQTPVGRCARYAYLTHARTPGSTTSIDYRMPFVYDSSTGNCYVLHVSMQQLKGDRYCSTYGQPAGLQWYCFHPAKSYMESSNLVYGSAYMGEESVDPDGWKTKCPTHAVRGALFGHWTYGACLAVDAGRSDVGVQSVAVRSKQECWEQVFAKSASDEAVASNPANWDSIWPTFDSTSVPSRAPTASHTTPSAHLRRKTFRRWSTPELEEAEEAAVVEEVKAVAEEAVAVVVKAVVVKAVVVKAVVVKAVVVKAVVVKVEEVKAVEEEEQEEQEEQEDQAEDLEEAGVPAGALLEEELTAVSARRKRPAEESSVASSSWPELLEGSSSAAAPSAPPEHSVDQAEGGAVGRTPTEANVQPEESFWKGDKGTAAGT
ncbi:hypothetical protein Emag_005821 [Eimeria magna]